MSNNDRRGTKSPPSSAPPGPAAIDSNWDDETVPGLDLDDPLNEFDRVTAIPALPSEQYVKSVMATAEDSRVPPPGSAPPKPPPPLRPPLPAIQSLSPEEYFSLDSEPPPEPRSPDSTARYAAFQPHNAPTARPPAPTRPIGTPTVPAQSLSRSGLELADLGSDSPAAPQALPETNQHDPRDSGAGVVVGPAGASGGVDGGPCQRRCDWRHEGPLRDG